MSPLQDAVEVRVGVDLSIGARVDHDHADPPLPEQVLEQEELEVHGAEERRQHDHRGRSSETLGQETFEGQGIETGS